MTAHHATNLGLHLCARVIRVQGWPSEAVVVKDNRHVGAQPGEILNEANATVSDNTNYQVVTAPRE